MWLQLDFKLFQCFNLDKGAEQLDTRHNMEVLDLKNIVFCVLPREKNTKWKVDWISLTN